MADGAENYGQADPYAYNEVDNLAYGQPDLSPLSGSDYSGTALTTGTEASQSARSATMMALVVTFCILAFVIIVGVLLAFTMGDSDGPTEGIESDKKGEKGVESNKKGEKRDDEKRSTTDGSGNEPVVMADLPAVQIRVDVPPTIIPTPASTAPATNFSPAPTPSPSTAAPRKSGILFCVVGESFANPDLFNRQLCNYIVYPDLVAAGSTIVPIHGETSWEAFRVGAAANSNTRAGVSFSAGKTGADNNTLDLVPTLRAQLTDIVRRLELSALGVLDFPYHQGSSVKSLEMPFKVFEEELVQQVKPMVFLGVGLISSSLANDFASQVVTMKYVTTIILQTHVSPLRVAGDVCFSQPISWMNATAGFSSFEVALQAVASLRSLGYNQRVVLSSTLGVMVYRGKRGSSQPTNVRQECDYSWMTNSDFTCTAGLSSTDEHYDNVGLYAYATYHNIDRDYFLTWESEQSLKAKLDLFKDSSDGWALFEVHRDVWRPCGKDEDYLRIALIQKNARLLGNG